MNKPASRRPNAKSKPPRYDQGGFTLLELLAVIFIIGIIVSFASLSVRQSTSRTVEDEAERIYNLLRLASEEAVLQGRELALEFSPHAYGFVIFNGNEWQPLEQDKQLRKREMEEVIELSLTLEGAEMDLKDKENPPRIMLLSSGEITPFELQLKIEDAEAFQIQGGLNGKLNLSRLERKDG